MKKNTQNLFKRSFMVLLCFIITATLFSSTKPINAAQKDYLRTIKPGKTYTIKNLDPVTSFVHLKLQNGKKYKITVWDVKSKDSYTPLLTASTGTLENGQLFPYSFGKSIKCRTKAKSMTVTQKKGRCVDIMFTNSNVKQFKIKVTRIK